MPNALEAWIDVMAKSKTTRYDLVSLNLLLVFALMQ
jgi:hypothetical protein